MIVEKHGKNLIARGVSFWMWNRTVTNEKVNAVPLGKKKGGHFWDELVRLDYLNPPYALRYPTICNTFSEVWMNKVWVCTN